MIFIKNILVATIALLLNTPSYAQIKNAKTETVKIFGNCIICQKKIDSAGFTKKISVVKWNKDSKLAVLVYDSTKTNRSEILTHIANAGYDSENYIAPTDVYNNLMDCCKYRTVLSLKPLAMSNESSPSNDKQEELNPYKVETKLSSDSSKLITGVTIFASQAHTTSTVSSLNTIKIGKNELRKAPCCNLSESFETTGAADVSYTDALTGAKEIQLLGLRGTYTQLLTENRADGYGLATPFAAEFIPGTWIESIEVNKGVSSVRNGSTALTGQVNTELVKPNKDSPVFVNVYGESTQRIEANVHLDFSHDLAMSNEPLAMSSLKDNLKINDQGSKFKAHSSLLLHGSVFENKIDKDYDAFLDIPLKKEFNALYRVFFENKKWAGQFNVQALTDSRKNGQLLYNIPNAYVVNIDNNRVSGFGKIAYTGFEKPYNGLGLQFSTTYHNLDALIGKNNLNGTQRSVYANLIQTTIIGTTDNKLAFGGSFQSDDYALFLNKTNLSRQDNTLGVFSEYTYTQPVLGEDYNRVTLIAGLRLENTNNFGFYFVPRLNVKYSFNEGDAVRASIGRGVRLPLPIIDNIGLLTTNREVFVAPDIRAESAVTASVSYQKSIDLGDKKLLNLNTEYFYTTFQNQIIADIESQTGKTLFYNLNGDAFSHTLNVTASADITHNLSAHAVYKFTNSQTTIGGMQNAETQHVESLLTPKQRGLIGLDFKTTEKKWLVSTTLQYIGTQRLANRANVPEFYFYDSYTGYSPQYFLLNASINRFFKKFELYGGAENLTDYVQHHPIIAFADPSSPYFDATQVYAPMYGRRFYLGFRWKL